MFSKTQKIRPIKLTIIAISFIILICWGFHNPLENRLRLLYGRFVSNNSTMQWINYVEAWYDATDSQSFGIDQISDNSKVSGWQSSKIRYNTPINLIQNDDKSKPLYITKGIAGLPSLKFDGIDDFLFSKHIQPNVFQYKSASLFAVIKNDQITTPANQQTLFYQEGVCQKYFDVSIDRLSASGNFDSDHNCQPSQSSRYLLNFTSKKYLDSHYILGLVFKRDDFANHHEYKITLYINGHAQDIQIIKVPKNILAKPSLNPDNMSFGNFYLGGKTLSNEIARPTTKPSLNQIFNNFQGLIGEIIIFNCSLNQNDQYLLEKYLGRKWNIKINKRDYE